MKQMELMGFFLRFMIINKNVSYNIWINFALLWLFICVLLFSLMYDVFT